MNFTTYFINIVIVIIVEILLLIFDSSLKLGDFQGFVFYIYSLYFIVGLAIINLILGIIKKRKNKEYKEYFISAATLLFLLLMIGIMIEIFS